MLSPARLNPGYGRGVHIIEAEPSADPDLLVRLTDTFRSPSYEPPLLPTSALELLEMSRQTETPFREVIRVLESDPFIAARVMRVAQSPVYVRGEPVRTLEQALSRMGMTTLAQIFLQVTLSAKVFRAPGYEAPMERLRKHSVATAHAARLIARQTSLFDDLAFLCGLLHDIGAALALIALAELRPRNPPPAYARVRTAVDEVHSDAGGIVCRAWKLPGEVRLVLAHHHHPVVQGMPYPMACVVVLADALATEHGFAAPSGEIPHTDLARQALGFSDAKWKWIDGQFHDLAAQLTEPGG